MHRTPYWNDSIGDFIAHKARDPNFLTSMVQRQAKHHQTAKIRSSVQNLLQTLQLSKITLQQDQKTLQEHENRILYLHQEHCLLDRAIQQMGVLLEKVQGVQDLREGRDSMELQREKESEFKRELRQAEQEYAEERNLLQGQMRQLVAERVRGQERKEQFLEQLRRQRQIKEDINMKAREVQKMKITLRQLKQRGSYLSAREQEIKIQARKWQGGSKQKQEKMLEDLRKRLESLKQELKKIVLNSHYKQGKKFQQILNKFGASRIHRRTSLSLRREFQVLEGKGLDRFIGQEIQFDDFAGKMSILVNVAGIQRQGLERKLKQQFGTEKRRKQRETLDEQQRKESIKMSQLVRLEQQINDQIEQLQKKCEHTDNQIDKAANQAK